MEEFILDILGKTELDSDIHPFWQEGGMRSTAENYDDFLVNVRNTGQMYTPNLWPCISATYADFYL